MRILTLLVAALFAATLQFMPHASGTAHAATKQERAAAKKRAALRAMRKRLAAKKKAQAKKAARARAERRKALKRRSARTRKADRKASRRTARTRKVDRRKNRRVARRTASRPKVNTRRRVVPSQYRRRTVFLRSREKPGTIIVDTNKKYLYLVKSRTHAIRYGIGVGREGFGWGGEVKVAAKKEWPSWTPPKEMIEREWKQNRRRVGFMEGGPGNPMGARALYLHKRHAGDTGYRIHGTNEPWSIGLAMSSGCVRMLNKDVTHLYERVRVGSKVIVIGPGGPGKRGTYSTSIFGL